MKRAFVGHVRILAKNWLMALSLLRKKNLERWLNEFGSMSDIALEQFYLRDVV